MDEETFVSRRLIRPSLSTTPTRTESVPERRERPDRNDRNDRPARRNFISEQTHAENYYYQKQIQLKTPVMVVLKDGEQVQGVIEWYDRKCIKLICNGATLMIYKAAIRYLYKAGEAEKTTDSAAG